MSLDLNARLHDLKARQDAGESMLCPRCGRKSMKLPHHTNALSREADVYVCDNCGTNEALRAMMNNPLPLSAWAFVTPQRPPSDLKTLTHDEAVLQIQSQQLPYLVNLYSEWLANGREDFGAYRNQALENCPGLMEIWEQPPQAIFPTREGRILIRFKFLDNGIEIAIDRLSK